MAIRFGPLPSTAPQGWRGLGVALAALGAVTLALMAGHAGGPTGASLVETLRADAADSGRDALVYGGYILVLVLQGLAFAVLAVRLGPGRISVLAGLILGAAGAAALSASMLVDGLIVPAIAACYAGAPADRLGEARALLAPCDSLIRFLMPIGLGFQAAATAAWGAALARERGALRGVGRAGLVLGLAVLAGLAATWRGLDAMVLMAGLGGGAMWIAAPGHCARLRLEPGGARSWRSGLTCMK
jgi:hypothetical protein